jgi:hypothetical protein
MIQTCGAQSYEQVVAFCRDVGIPLGRMLRLDLMGLINQTNDIKSDNITIQHQSYDSPSNVRDTDEMMM